MACRWACMKAKAASTKNQLGRSRAFTGWLFGAMQAEFGGLNIDSADAFHAAVNRVHKGLYPHRI